MTILILLTLMVFSVGHEKLTVWITKIDYDLIFAPFWANNVDVNKLINEIFDLFINICFCVDFTNPETYLKVFGIK